MSKVIYIHKRKKEGGKTMPTIYDVANYFISRSNNDEENSMTALKLQKLCYYAQAWSLVWDDKELFCQDFQAWVHGPANYDLWNKYRRNGSKIIYVVDDEYNQNVFDKEENETLEAVWDAYGKYTGKYLEQLTHEEEPWLKTRGTLPPGMSCDINIDKKLIKDYYSNL